MLTGIVWHGIGVFCVFGIIRLFRRLREQLRRAGWKVICATLCTGIVSGVVGTLWGFMLSDMVIRFNPTSDIRMAVRAITGAFLFILGAALVGYATGRALHKICRKDAVFSMALMTSALLILQPVAYGWFMWVWSVLSGLTG